MNEANILPSNFSDRTTPLPNKKAYAVDKANSEKKPVSLKKAPWDVKKEEVERDKFGFGYYGDDHRIVISPKTHQGKIIKSTGLHTVKKTVKKQKREEANLDEAKTDIYHKHMLKALGKTRLPKDHGYTSSIANNGDFVVRKGGEVAGRIPKGEHNLKEAAENSGE